MRNLFLTVAAIAALAVPAAAQTGAVSFTIHNNSDQTIDAILYDDELEDCMYDFAYSFDDGSAYVERVDMCEINGGTFEFTGG